MREGIGRDGESEYASERSIRLGPPKREGKSHDPGEKAGHERISRTETAPVETRSEAQEQG